MYVHGGNKARVGNSFVCHFRSIRVWEAVLPLSCILTLYIVHIVYIYIYTYIFTCLLPKKIRIICIHSFVPFLTSIFPPQWCDCPGSFFENKCLHHKSQAQKGVWEDPAGPHSGTHHSTLAASLVLGLSLHCPVLKLTKCPTFSSAEQDKSNYW